MAILATPIARPTTSAGRFWPWGPLGTRAPFLPNELVALIEDDRMVAVGQPLGEHIGRILDGGHVVAGVEAYGSDTLIRRAFVVQI